MSSFEAAAPLMTFFPWRDEVVWVIVGLCLDHIWTIWLETAALVRFHVGVHVVHSHGGVGSPASPQL